MASRLKDIKFGHCTIEDLAYWINERHSIFVNRFEKELPKPWTDDLILQQYKFTNAFRQLDKGTLALRGMLMRRQTNDPALIFFNVCWYRLFNWFEHAEELGIVYSFNELKNYINGRFARNKRIFTGAHMTTGVAYEFKHESYLRAAKMAWDQRKNYAEMISEYNAQGKDAMQNVFQILLGLYMVGRFVAYEIVCDLRFTSLLENATDKLTWANLGPGAQRGLKRLGLPHKNQAEGLESMVVIYNKFIESNSLLDWNVLTASVPFELREVEHSLCEFDKYQRVKMGEGRPRGKFNGV